MRVIVLLLLLFPFLAPPKLRAEEVPSSISTDAPAAVAPISTENLQRLLERGVSEGLIAGGVIVVGNHEGILASVARGRVSASPAAPAITDRTLFDVASLTKVIATSPAILKLLDEGRIALNDPVSRWFPELAGTDKGNITVLHLMTHTSGLSDVMVGSGGSMERLLQKVAAERFRGAGTGFDYADINFILLGELVRRVSGERLDRFCHDEIYQPLGTRDTSFLPARDDLADIAPTSGETGGVVQDINARNLGGVAGHAGLFTTAYDLARYARLMLGRGSLDGTRIFSEQAVAEMTTPYLCNNGRVKRGLGWDMGSPFSAPKGNYFSDNSFGHTGYSGSSIWIDPKQDLFVIMLTRRLDYRNVHEFNQLRRDVSTVAAAEYNGLPGESDVLPSRPVRVKPSEVVRFAVLKRAGGIKLASIKWRGDRRPASCSVKPGRRTLHANALHRGKAVRVSKALHSGTTSKVAAGAKGKVRRTASKKHRSTHKG